jgi:flagella basal body P-ring formation protein FlgA
VEPSGLRATFEAPDRAALSRPLSSATLIIQPVSSDASATAVVQVRLVNDGSIIEARTVHAQVEVERQVLVTRRMIAAKRAIGPEDLAPEQRWVAPATASPFASVQDAVGAFVRTRLEPGTVLRPDHVLSPIAVKRNELVTVYSVSDGFEIKVQARAKTDARVGEVIEFRTERSKSWFRARVDGPGVAVVVMDVETPGAADASAPTDQPAAELSLDAVVPGSGAAAAVAPGITVTRTTPPSHSRTSERAP